MQCKICNGEMLVIFTGIGTVPFVKRRRKCTGCEREVTTFENVFEPATGELAEHLITQHLVYTPESLITAFRSLSKASREIVLELANTGEPAFNSPTLVVDIQKLQISQAKPAAAVAVDKKVKKSGPQPGWQQRKADRLAAEAAGGGGKKRGPYKKRGPRGPRTEAQKVKTAALKKANAEKRAQEAQKPGHAASPTAEGKKRPTLSIKPSKKAKTGHVDAVDKEIAAFDKKEAAYTAKTAKRPGK